jgi:hypothetical protein
MIFNLRKKRNIFLEINLNSNTFLIGVVRCNLTIKRFCSRSRNFGIFSNGMFPHFLISPRFKYVANAHINARLRAFLILFQSSIYDDL